MLKWQHVEMFYVCKKRNFTILVSELYFLILGIQAVRFTALLNSDFDYFNFPNSILFILQIDPIYTPNLPYGYNFLHSKEFNKS